MQTVQHTIDWILARPAVYAPLLGFLASVGATQRIKRCWPRHWSDPLRHWSTVGLAAVLAFAVTVIAYPHRIGIAEGITVAAIAPMLWAVVVRLVGLWSADLRKALSGDRE